MITRQHKMYIPHPASQYAKYRSQSKTNALLHRLNNDSGYPQEIIFSPQAYQSKNYLRLNKQNLKNFFADRIPAPQAKLANLNQTIDPTRIYQIKKQQYQLRHNAGKTPLNGTIRITSKQQIHKERIRKISQIFALNDKTLEFKLKFFDVTNQTPSIVYPPENYRRGTKSFVDKKKSLTKKEAYEKVFGIELSSTIKTRKFQDRKKQFSKTENFFYTKSASVPIKAPTVNSRAQQKQTISKERIGQFRRIIGRIKEHNQQFSSNMHQRQIQNSEEKDMSSNRQFIQANSETLIEWMRNCGKQYQTQYNKNTTVELKELDDIQKIDAEFYEKMYEHKKRRLNRRMDFVDKSSLYELSSIIHSPIKNKNKKEQDRISMISNLSQQQFEEPKLIKKNTTLFRRKKTTKEKFTQFCEQLKKTLQYSSYYGVAKKNIYSAFWKLASPYQKEGSYSFFKAIKRGQLEAVKIFISKDIEYAFEVDDKKRSPLMNAIKYNHEDIVEYLLSVGVNVDAQCNARKKPLYYAISNSNWSIVQKLLRCGAQPWSTKYCNYNELQKTKQIQILLKNAKKIHIASCLRKWVERLPFWFANKELILSDKIIDFEKETLL